MPHLAVCDVPHRWREVGAVEGQPRRRLADIGRPTASLPPGDAADRVCAQAAQAALILSTRQAAVRALRHRSPARCWPRSHLGRFAPSRSSDLRRSHSRPVLRPCRDRRRRRTLVYSTISRVIDRCTRRSRGSGAARCRYDLIDCGLESSGVGPVFLSGRELVLAGRRRLRQV